MSVIAASAVAALLATGIAGTAYAADTVDIPDDGLRACINAALGQAADDDITEAQAAGITGRLECTWRGIENLTGAEHLTGIDELDLRRNDVSDLGPLAGLVGLSHLALEANDVSDLGPLAGLVGLTHLDLLNNDVADLTPVAGLVNLEYLRLQANGRIEDITPLAGLTKLERLNLWGNKIEDISVLAGLTALENLWLHSNRITDVSPVADLPNLTALRFEANQVTDISVLATLGLTTFAAGSQDVDLGEVFVGEPVANPIVGLDGQPVPLDDLYDAADNSFTPTDLGAGSVGWEVTEVFGTGPGTYSDRFAGTLSFTAVEPAAIDIPDPALRECVNEALGQDSDADINQVQARWISALYCEDSGIVDLTGIGELTQLGHFVAPDNAITDLGPLAALGSMVVGLDLRGNLIEDVTPLADMIFGEEVLLDGNRITDVSPLADVAALTMVSARDQVVDLGERMVAEPHDNPVVGFDGAPVALSDLYDAGENTFTPVLTGDASLTWFAGADESDALFTGTLLFAVIEAPEPPAEESTPDLTEEPTSDPSEEPAPGPAADPTQAPAPPALPQAGSSELPATGASVGPVALLTALVLIVAGAALVMTQRRRT